MFVLYRDFFVISIAYKYADLKYGVVISNGAVVKSRTETFIVKVLFSVIANSTSASQLGHMSVLKNCTMFFLNLCLSCFFRFFFSKYN